MTQQANFSLDSARFRTGKPTGRGNTTRSEPPQGRKVTGKVQLAISAIGMFVVLITLVWGTLLEASAVFLLTIGALEIMFQRALTVFHASSGVQTMRLAPIGHETPQSAGAGD